MSKIILDPRMSICGFMTVERIKLVTLDPSAKETRKTNLEYVKKNLRLTFQALELASGPEILVNSNGFCFAFFFLQLLIFACAEKIQFLIN